MQQLSIKSNEFFQLELNTPLESDSIDTSDYNIKVTNKDEITLTYNSPSMYDDIETLAGRVGEVVIGLNHEAKIIAQIEYNTCPAKIIKEKHVIIIKMKDKSIEQLRFVALGIISSLTYEVEGYDDLDFTLRYTIALDNQHKERFMKAIKQIGFEITAITPYELALRMDRPFAFVELINKLSRNVFKMLYAYDNFKDW